MPDWRTELQARLRSRSIDPLQRTDLIEELSQHLEDRYNDLLASGASDDEARRLALDELDDDEVLARRVSASHMPVAAAIVAAPTKGSVISDLAQDVRYATRAFRQAPGFTTVVVTTLALGIGATTALFSLVEATLLRRLAVQAPEELVYLYNGQTGNVFSYPAFDALRNESTTTRGVAAWGAITTSLNADGETDLVSGLIVSGNFFEVLGVGPAEGRVLGRIDDLTPGAHPVVVISHALWTRRFGTRPDIVGHAVRLNGQPFTIVGVTPAPFMGPRVGEVRDIFVPMMMQAIVRPPRAGYSGEMNPDLLKNANNGWLNLIARLAPGVGIEQVTQEMGARATNFVRSFDASASARTVPAVPVGEADATIRQQVRATAWLLAAVVGTVLLIACANVANLLLSRAAAREREFAVRLALGASRRRLVRQLVTEAVMLAVLGGAAGTALTWLIVRMFAAAPPPAGALPFVLQVAINWRVLLVAAATSVVTGLVIGLLAAWSVAKPSLVPSLKDDGADKAGAGRLRLRRWLVVAEVAAALGLVFTSTLLLRSLSAAYAIDPGITHERLLSASVNINLLRYTRAQGRAFYQQALEQIETQPGVRSAALARVALFSGGGRTLSFLREGQQGTSGAFRSEGGPQAELNAQTIRANVVSPRFFDTLGIAIIAGRDLSAADVEGAPLVTFNSESAAKRHFPDVAAVGQRVSFEGIKGPWVEIVGVVKDSNYARLGEDPTPVAYLPLAQNHETGMVLYVSSSVPPATLVPAVRRALQSLEPNLPVPDVQPLAQSIAASLYVPRMGARLVTAFGGLALLLATIGVYGVMAFAWARRRRELGVRVALGATRRDVFGLVLGDGARLVALGVAIGVAVSLAAARGVQSFLYGIDAYDVTTLALAVATLVMAAAWACVIPARRAAAADPLSSLRAE